MSQVVIEFFQLSGLDVVPPQTFGELVPYLLQFVVALALVLAVFRVIGAIVQALLQGRLFR